MSPTTFEYFPIQGRGEPVRFALADLEIPYEESGMAAFRANYADLDQYPFQQVPRLTIDGKSFVQTNAILEFLTTRAGKNGSGDILERYEVSALMFAVEDYATKYSKAAYTPDNHDILVTFATETAPKALAQFEHILKKSKTDYFFWDHPSYAEYHLLYVLTVTKALRPTIFDAETTAFPLLAAWFERIQTRKGIATYLASGKQSTQFNGNPSADKAVC